MRIILISDDTLILIILLCQNFLISNIDNISIKTKKLTSNKYIYILKKVEDDPCAALSELACSRLLAKCASEASGQSTSILPMFVCRCPAVLGHVDF